MVDSEHKRHYYEHIHNTGGKMEKKHITARLEKSLVEKIKEMARNEGRSLNNMIERMLKDATDEKK